MKPETFPTDYGMWRLFAWCGPIFMATFFFMWGVLAGNLPPVGTPAQVQIENAVRKASVRSVGASP